MPCIFLFLWHNKDKLGYKESKQKLKMPEKQILKFPKGFLWGAATSAYQTEGNNSNSDWWPWEYSLQRAEELTKAGKDPKDYLSGIACDFYNRYDEDFALAEHLNHSAIRFGIEWSRIEPREGEYREEVLDHYEKMLQSAKFHGLQVFLTLHHFTVPFWFLKKGGFTKKQNVQIFLKYVEVVAKRLGQYVDFWITINEPEVYATHAYFFGKFPPEQKSFITCVKVVNNLITAHNQASRILKFETGKPVSIAYHLNDFQPVGWISELNTVIAHYLSNEYILNRTIEHCDFIGVNYYNHHHVGLFGFRSHSHTGHDVTDQGWSIHPEGIERVLLNLKKYNKPVYVTENGLSDKKDTKREKYIKDHLFFVHKAIEKGVDIRGYLYWSLTDNFEWHEGFGPRFGLIEIDREDFLRRKVRFSATKFAEICKSNQMEHETKS